MIEEVLRENDISDIFSSMELISEEANKNVRPSSKMIKFYNWFGKLSRKITIPILLLTSIDAWKVLFFAGVLHRTDAAIQVLYNHKIRPWRLLWGIGDIFWQNAYNCKSVRARGFFVKKALESLILENQKLIKFSRKSVIASIGSGSANQLFQGIKESGFKDKAELILVDCDLRTLERGKKNAEKFDISVKIYNKTAGSFLIKRAPESIDIVEKVGLTDYFLKSKHLENYFRRTYNVLKPKGFFLGANISSKEECEYAHGAICWPKMAYRTEEEIISILQKTGFVSIWTQKCGLYVLWLAQKD